MISNFEEALTAYHEIHVEVLTRSLTEKDKPMYKLSQDEKLELIRSDLAALTSDQILLLFDPETDHSHAGLLNYAAVELFNIGRVEMWEQFSRQSAHLGNEAAQENLFWYYFRNNNIVEAIKYGEDAFRAGRLESSEMAVLFKIKLDNYGVENSKTYLQARSEAHLIPLALDIIEHIAYDEKSDLRKYCSFLLGTFYANGNGRTKDIEKAMELYLTSLKRGDRNAALALRNLVIRRGLGIGTNQDVEESLGLFELTSHTKCECTEKYDALNAVLNNFSSVDYISAIEFFKDFISSGSNFADLKSDLALVEGKFSEAYSNVTEVFASLAKSEGWPDCPKWHELNLFVQAQRFSLQLSDLNRFTFKLGPFYNSIAANGLPVLGQYEAANYVDPQKLIKPISSGLRRFTAVEGDSAGNLNFRFDSSDGPALIFPEDIDVALMLAFASHEFSWPSIDIDIHDEFKGLKNHAQEKIWDPAWLQSTAFGKTLYITDFLGGRLSWDLAAFELPDPENPLRGMAQRFVSQLLSVTGAKPQNSTASMINVNPKIVNLSIKAFQTKNGGTATRVEPLHIAMRISGGYEINHDQKWAHKDDVNFLHGNRTQTLTDHFDDVCVLLPVFERLRQLVAIIYSLEALRNRGFRPNEEIMTLIQDNLRTVERESSELPTEYARTIPLFNQPMISC